MTQRNHILLRMTLRGPRDTFSWLIPHLPSSQEVQSPTRWDQVGSRNQGRGMKTHRGVDTDDSQCPGGSSGGFRTTWSPSLQAQCTCSRASPVPLSMVLPVLHTHPPCPFWAALRTPGSGLCLSSLLGLPVSPSWCQGWAVAKATECDAIDTL